MKKIIILSLMLVVMGLTACSSSDKAASVPVSKAEGKNEGTDKNKAPAEETETEPTTESTSTDEQYITTGITIGDETLYINNHKAREVVKFFQQAGIDGSIDMTEEVEPGQVANITLGKRSYMEVYNTTSETQKAGDCRVSLLHMKIEDYPTIRIVNSSMDSSTTLPQAEQILSDLGITFEGENSIYLKDRLPTGQDIKLELSSNGTKEHKICSIRLWIPQLID